MSNLEDVFLKINKEYAPDLFSGSRDVVPIDEPKLFENLSEQEQLKQAASVSVLNDSADGRSSRSSSIARNSLLEYDKKPIKELHDTLQDESFSKN